MRKSYNFNKGGSKNTYRQYQFEEDRTKKMLVSDDKTFINNLFLMSRNRKFEFRKFDEMMQSIDHKRCYSFVHQYGISSELVEQLIDNAHAGKLEEFVVAKYEENKPVNPLKEESEKK